MHMSKFSYIDSDDEETLLATTDSTNASEIQNEQPLPFSSMYIIFIVL